MTARTKWALRLLAAAALTVGLHAVSGNAGSAPRTVTLCYEDLDVRPWRYQKGGGLNFQLLEGAARQAGVALRYEGTTWSNCLSRLQNNEVDGAFAVRYRPDRIGDGIYPGGQAPDGSKRLHADSFVLVRRKGEALAWDGRSLAHADGAIAVQAGYAVAAHVQRLGAVVDDSVAGAEEVLRKLAAAEVSGATLLAGEARRVLEHDAYLRARLEIMTAPLVEEPYYLVLSRAFVQSHPEQAAGLWHGIEVIRTSAAYRSLEKRTLAALGQS